MKTKLHINIIIITVLLVIMGLATLYSASSVESLSKSAYSASFVIKQITFGLLVGILLFYIGYKVPLNFFKKYTVFFVFAALLFLAALKIPDLAISAGGATRWLDFGFFTFQPSEFAKLALIIYLAKWFDRNQKNMVSVIHYLAPISVVLVVLLLVMSQPDMGTAMIIGITCAIILFAGGIPWKLVGYGIIFSFASILALIKFESYRFKRLVAFLNPEIDPLGISYHINQAMLAIGSGGLWGYGYGMSRQKYNYLPEAFSDSIFAILAEEMGFIRVALVILAFFLLFYFGLKISKNASDKFGRLLALGISFWIAIQAVLNIGAMTNLIPLTGIPLPFFSYGSSSLAINLFGIGILANIAKTRGIK